MLNVPILPITEKTAVLDKPIIKSLALAFCLALLVSTAHAQILNSNSYPQVSGSASATGTGATTIIAAPSGSQAIYVDSVQCSRTDAGTTAIRVTFNDAKSTTLTLPNAGGGGGNNANFLSPITPGTATAFTFTASAGTSTVYCNAQGYTR
jgi:hypothetical protein